MKYYFTGSTKRLSEDGPRYQLINRHLVSLGCKPLNYVHFSKDDSKRQKYEQLLANNKKSVYELQTSLIDQADMLIADVTSESVTVGYQIDYAVRKKIPVLVLINNNNENALPVMLTDDHLGLLTVEKYSSDEEIKDILDKFKNLVISEKIKFNFFLNIPIHNYLTQRAAKEKLNKSSILRKIILEEIKRNPL